MTRPLRLALLGLAAPLLIAIAVVATRPRPPLAADLYANGCFQTLEYAMTSAYIAQSGDAIALFATNSAMIHRRTTAGQKQTFDPQYSQNPRPGFGPDGNVWYTKPNQQKITKFLPNGTAHFSDGTRSDFGVGGTPQRFVTAGDSLWITTSAGQLVRMNADGSSATLNVPGIQMAIAGGPGDTVWWVGGHEMRNLNTATMTLTDFGGIPFPQNSSITDLAIGANGAAWMLQAGDGIVLRRDAGGAWTSYGLGVALKQGSIGVHGDTAWFLDMEGRVNRLTAGGQWTQYEKDVVGAGALAVTADGTVFLTTNRLVTMNPSSCPVMATSQASMQQAQPLAAPTTQQLTAASSSAASSPSSVAPSSAASSSTAVSSSAGPADVRTEWTAVPASLTNMSPSSATFTLTNAGGQTAQVGLVASGISMGQVSGPNGFSCNLQSPPCSVQNLSPGESRTFTVALNVWSDNCPGTVSAQIIAQPVGFTDPTPSDNATDFRSIQLLCASSSSSSSLSPQTSSAPSSIAPSSASVAAASSAPASVPSSSARSSSAVPVALASSASSAALPVSAASSPPPPAPAVSSASSVPAPVCGNWIPEAGEQCDDGNTEGNDGCSPTCRFEVGFACTLQGCAPVCGDGIKTGDERCDDGNARDGDGCNAQCDVEPWYACPTAGKPCTPVCGDGNDVPPETCDDGNARDGDGCGADCRMETGWICAGRPSQCIRLAASSSAQNAVGAPSSAPAVVSSRLSSAISLPSSSIGIPRSSAAATAVPPALPSMSSSVIPLTPVLVLDTAAHASSVRSAASVGVPPVTVAQQPSLDVQSDRTDQGPAVIAAGAGSTSTAASPSSARSLPSSASRASSVGPVVVSPTVPVRFGPLHAAAEYAPPLAAHVATVTFPAQPVLQQTGPASLAAMAVGGAVGTAWMRRRQRRGG